MKDNWALSLHNVLQSEGGFVDDPQDPGGATDEGITQHIYDLWRANHGQTIRSVRFIDQNEEEALYAKNYWTPINGDALPAGLDYALFDFAVNSGIFRAVSYLQKIVETSPDGDLGNGTLAAIKEFPVNELINELCDKRLAFLQSLPTWGHFGRGWSARIAGVRAEAELMAA